MTIQGTTTIDAGVAATNERTSRYDGTRIMKYAAAAGLVAGTLFWGAGMATSPEQASMADADYVASLARNLTQTQVSALLLHYGNLLIGLGILAAPTLVRGRRGGLLVTVGALLTAIGFTNVAGMILSDWWNAAIGTHLPVEEAAKIFGVFKESSLLWIWNGTEMLSLVGAIALFVGLARAGVLGWYTLALFLGGFAALILTPTSLPQVAGLLVLVGFSPFALVGVRLVQRLRVER